MKRILTGALIGASILATPSFAIDAGNSTETQAVPRIVERTPSESMQKVPDPSNEETGSINPATLQSGENSFTENQARQHIEKAGFTNVGTLTLDEQGIWRGTARKGATNVNVGLDFKGNVAAEKSATQ